MSNNRVSMLVSMVALLLLKLDEERKTLNKSSNEKTKYEKPELDAQKTKPQSAEEKILR
jgi:hypothetical protein